MTAQRDIDTILAAWLDEGPTDLPDATRRAIVTALPATTQARRGLLLAPWRFFDMNGFGRLAGVALVAVLAIGGLFYLLNPRPGPGGVSPSPTTVATLTPSATTAPAVTPAVTAGATPAATISVSTFTSPQYGYTVQHPTAWTARPATGTWPAGEPVSPDLAYVDQFVPAGAPLSAAVMMAAQPIPTGTTGQEWLTAWADQRAAEGQLCFGPASAWTDARVGDVEARRLEAPCSPESGITGNFLEYAWVVDGVGYVITGAPVSVVELIAASFQAG